MKTEYINARRERTVYIYIYILKNKPKNVQKRYKNRQKLPCVSTLKNREMMQTKKLLFRFLFLLFHLFLLKQCNLVNKKHNSHKSRGPEQTTRKTPMILFFSFRFFFRLPTTQQTTKQT